MTAKTHHYEARCAWRGSTAGGYHSYDRTHVGWCPPAEATVTISADPAFGGTPSAFNPEQLVVLAAASCQLLSFLALAALAGMTVLGYDDEASATMADARPPMSIDAISLHPTITVSADTDVDDVVRLVSEAHAQCFIANTLRCPVSVDPVIIMEGS